MGLSSNILWHQTKKDGLRGIIKDKCLYISYSVEDITSANYDVSFAYPMVSVCDLPLAETGDFLKRYGGYTIGFSSDWGKRNHFSSVWYCDKNSIALGTLLSMLGQKISSFSDRIELDEDYQKIVYILSYIKQYEGALPKRHYKKYRFYDERELRFVPIYDSLQKIGESPFLWDYNKYKKEHGNSSLLPKSINVPFEWEDVRYIIVERDDEKKEFKELVENSSKRSDLNILYLTNKDVREDIIGINHDVKDIDYKFNNNSIYYNPSIEKVLEELKESFIRQIKNNNRDNK